MKRKRFDLKAIGDVTGEIYIFISEIFSGDCVRIVFECLFRGVQLFEWFAKKATLRKHKNMHSDNAREAKMS